jgi:hypothetical protein
LSFTAIRSKRLAASDLPDHVKLKGEFLAIALGQMKPGREPERQAARECLDKFESALSER